MKQIEYFVDPDFGPRDPQWVGAWWLGFVICSLLSVTWAAPMILFPPVLLGGEGKVISTKEGQDIMSKAKGSTSYSYTYLYPYLYKDYI